MSAIVSENVTENRRSSRRVVLVLLSPALALPFSGCSSPQPAVSQNDCDRNRATATREDDCNNSRRTRVFPGGALIGSAAARNAAARRSTSGSNSNFNNGGSNASGSERGGFGGTGRFFGSGS